MTGHGGWPLNAFLTPEQAPFYAGTYFPPEPRHGLPSWRMVLLAVADAWAAARERDPRAGRPDRPVAGRDRPARALARADPRGRCSHEARRRPAARPTTRANGGLGGAPKFPPASTIELLLARGEREMSLRTLRGDGARRHLRPGRRRLLALRGRRDLDRARTSRRCSTTTRCSRAPTCTAGRCRARSACARCAARRSTGRCARCAAPRAASAPRSTPTPRASRGSSTCGRSTSSARARRGSAFELRSRTSARRAATSRTARTCSRPRAQPDLPEIRCKLLGARAERVRPGLDDKRLTAWNALMISALAEAGAALERATTSRPRRRARRSCSASCATARAGCCAPGRTAGSVGAYLEDHAFLLEALITLYEATFDPRWYHEAVALADTIIARFADPERGGFFTTARRPRAARRPPQGPRGLADPVGQLRRGVRAAAPRAAVGRGHSTSATRSGCCGCCSDRRRATRRRSATCCRRSTSTWRRCARWRSSGPTPREPLLRVVRGAFRPHSCSPAATGRRAAARGPRAGRRPRRRLRVRALRLSGAGDHAGGARRRTRGMTAIHSATRVRPSGQSPYKTGR